MEQKESKGNYVSRLADDRREGMELDELLADARRLSDTTGYERESKILSNSSAESDVLLKEIDQPESGSGDSMESMTAQMRALTEEVKLLRTQLANIQQEDHTGESDDVLPNIRVESEKTGKSKVLNIISSVLFYVVMIGIVIGALLVKSSSGGRPTIIAGFSAFRVLTSSMEDVYPKGSLIISRAVDPNELAIGDDITFMVSETSSVTHRIIGITQNYAGTGKPGFETQGVMNEKPDKDMVAAANVVGRVVFCSKALGDLANFMKNNWPLLAFVVVVFIALIAFLKWNARRTDDEAKSTKDAPRKHVRK